MSMQLGYIYTRLSTKNQSDTSFDAQEYDCHQFANKNNIKVVERFQDIGSAWKNVEELPEMKRMIRQIKNNSVIIVADVSRFSRDIQGSMNIMRKLSSKNVIIFSVLDNHKFDTTWQKHNSSSNMNFLNAVMVARNESDLKSQKALRVYEQKRRNGILLSTPFGKDKMFDKEKNKEILKENKNETKVLVDILHKYNEQKFTINKIVEYLTKKGITKRGKPFTYSMVQSILLEHNKFPKMKDLSKMI